MTHTSPDPERSILLSLDELMASPPSSRQIPDLSVSNDALRESLKPPPPVPLGTQVARLASARSHRLLWWYGTRPAWLQVALGGMAGSLIGLGVLLSYYVSTLPDAAPEVAAEPSGPGMGAALVAAAAPMISERVVQALAPASADTELAAAEAPAQVDAPAYSDDAAEDGSARSERRRSARRHTSKAHASSSALPSWVQQHVKPQARRATLADQKAAARERKAARKAAAREKQAAARARKAKTLAQK